MRICKYHLGVWGWTWTTTKDESVLHHLWASMSKISRTRITILESANSTVDAAWHVKERSLELTSPVAAK